MKGKGNVINYPKAKGKGELELPYILTLINLEIPSLTQFIIIHLKQSINHVDNRLVINTIHILRCCAEFQPVAHVDLIGYLTKEEIRREYRRRNFLRVVTRETNNILHLKRCPSFCWKEIKGDQIKGE